MIGEAIVVIVRAIAAATGKSEAATRDEAIAALRALEASPPRDMAVDADAMRRAFEDAQGNE
jgi:hypothetical protein